MNQKPDLLLVDWLTDGPDQGPRHALDRTLAATRRTAQRPGWVFPSTWLPAPLATRSAARPRSFAIILAAVLLAVALATIAVFVGSHRRTTPPFGLAGNGTILLDVDGSLWQADPDGSSPRPFAAGHLGRAFSPVHSPDGNQVAYLTQAGLWTPMSIFVASADGSGARNVTGDMKVIASPLDAPAWSPDGSTLVFTSSDQGISQIYTVGADGSGLTAITGSDASRRNPTWSPDGRWLAYQLIPLDPDERTQLAISRPDGSGERSVLSGSVHNSATLAAPQWGPDSKRLAYFTTDTRDSSVGVVDLDGAQTRLSRTGQYAFNPQWSADGRRLIYATEDDGSTVVDLDDPSRRVEIPRGLADCGAVWSPDATAILGLGLDCKALFRIPLADPASATPVDVPAGGISIASWQRTAP